MTDAEYLRKYLPESLPWAIRELIISNVVVGNYSMRRASIVADILVQHVYQQQPMSKGD